MEQEKQLLAYDQIKEVIGKAVMYQDYLGIQRFAIIGWLEPYLTDGSDGVYWLYLIDDDTDYNNKELVVNYGTPAKPDMRTIMYAEMRLSTEVSLDKWR